MNQTLFKVLEPIRNAVLRYLGLPKKNQLYGLKQFEVLNDNIKQLSQEFARIKSKENHFNLTDDFQLQNYKLGSKACTQKDCESEWFIFWCYKLRYKPMYLRKLWEYAIILQILNEKNYLQENKKVIAFGCGSEPLPSYFANINMQVLATDLDPNSQNSKGWLHSNQLLQNKNNLFKEELVSYEKFNELVNTSFVDMNNIPSDLKDFDIAYSICALEHVGSIEKGLSFIENTLNTIKKGGISIHTTEYNFSDDINTLDNLPTVLFQKKHFIELKDKLEKKGHKVLPLNFDIGNELFDRYIDLPPYHLTNNINNVNNQEPHLKLLLEEFKSTCFSFAVVKN